MSARVVVVVSARMASTRCPGKALAPLAGRPLLEVLLHRMATVRGVDGRVLATSMNHENDPLEAVARGAGWDVFRGDEEDVLRRHVECARAGGADHVVRVTGDNPSPTSRRRRGSSISTAARVRTTRTCPGTRS